MHKTRNYILYDQDITLQTSFGPCSFEPKREMSQCVALLPQWSWWQTQMAGFQPSVLSKEKETPDADEGTSDWASESGILTAHHWSQIMWAIPVSPVDRAVAVEQRVQLLGQREMRHDICANEWDGSWCQYASHKRGGGVIPGVLAPLT